VRPQHNSPPRDTAEKPEMGAEKLKLQEGQDKNIPSFFKPSRGFI
jgi:hypothetical protein